MADTKEASAKETPKKNGEPTIKSQAKPNKQQTSQSIRYRDHGLESTISDKRTTTQLNGGNKPKFRVDVLNTNSGRHL